MARYTQKELNEERFAATEASEYVMWHTELIDRAPFEITVLDLTHPNRMIRENAEALMKEEGNEIL